MTPLEMMQWSADPLVREIASEIDDRELHEIAESVYEIYFGGPNEGDGPEDCDDPMRAFAEPAATDRLTHDQAVEASTLAAQIVDWCNYGVAYGDFSSPPWRDEDEGDEGDEGDGMSPYDYARAYGPRAARDRFGPGDW